MKLAESQRGVPEGRVRVLVGPWTVIVDPECGYCKREIDAGNGFFPNHDARSSCQSGGYTHCTCDSCF